MNKQQAQQIIRARQIIRDTFENPFDKNEFTGFIRNLLNRIDDAPFTYQGNYIPDAYKQYIKTLERIGKFSDGENSIDILVITLQKETSLERARTMQRNFIAWYLNGSRGGEMKDAALAAFVSPDKEDWRFSLVKMDYKFEKTKTGKVKVKEEFTPARRWSFLVGANEKSHTAQSRLVNILANDEQSPTLKEIENAFDIETVTREFFLKYRELFLHTKEELDRVVDKDPKIKTDFEAKGVDNVNFAKKLLGQIIFLYFLQKKGWFGVGRDNDWGTGSKHFLRELFDKKHEDYKNFFNDILEPLFYEALRIDRSHDDGYYSRFDCKIPFLNGGLFDPIGNYDWVHTDIIIPDKLFSNNIKTKEGDTGTGILDVFDRYNFTVKEDEPLEKEVAIDPELLGKSYEKFNAIRPDNYDEFKNALESGKTGEENKFNKKFGVYYTPREIVHYMCQQSLINYLATELDGKANKEDIETLIHTGEQVSENEARVIQEGRETRTYSHKLTESIRKNAVLIDQKMAEITVCDPAVGSGAFPVGMMSEIVKTRNLLTTFIKDNNRTIYDFKRCCIEHSLYGVDIDPGAVEIAKLRLWLSLIVDEDDIKNIKPLPNLDYKIMQGNSLIELLSPELISSANPPKRDKLVRELKNAKEELFNITNPSRKNKMRAQIDELMNDIFEYDRIRIIKKLKDDIVAINSQTRLFEDEKYRKEDKKKILEIESKIEELKNVKIPGLTKHFEWHINYSEIFKEKGGFDVVIANPPYVRADSPDFKEQRQAIKGSKFYITLYEKWDLFVPFIEKGLKLLSVSGNLCFITSNSLCTSKFAFRILDYIQADYYTRFIDYFDNMQVFEAGVVPVVFGVSRGKTKEQVIKTIHSESFDKISRQEKIPIDEFKKSSKDAFKPTHHTVTIKKETVKLGDICYISYGLRPNSDERYWKGEFTRNDLVSEEKDKIHIKPYIEGKNLSRYRIDKILYLEWNTDRCPKKLVRPTFPELYNKPKLLCGTMTSGTFDNTGVICNHSIVVFVSFTNLKSVENKSISNSIKKFNTLPRSDLEKLSEKFDLKYLLAVLNSKFANCFLNGIRRHRLKNYFYPDDFRNMPIADIHPANQQPFITLIDRILDITKDDDYLQNQQKQVKVKILEGEIDQLVYHLYGLTEEEIKIVEGKHENTD